MRRTRVGPPTPTPSPRRLHPKALPTLALALTLALVSLLLPTPTQAGLPAPWRFESPLPQGNDLLAAWSPGGERLFAGGHGGVIMEWDGTRWTHHPTPTQKTIFALHGLSPSDIWAVGGDPYNDNSTNRCLILHFDGRSWTELAAPQFWNFTYPFNSVYAVAPNDVWATQDGGTFLAHYDGQSWDWVSLPLPVEGTFRTLTSAGPDHLYVAGTHGQILHRDHGTWKLEQKTESGNFSQSILQSMWAHSPEAVFAVGNWTQFYRRNPDATWQKLEVGASQLFGFGFTQVWGTSPTNVFLLDGQSVFHFDGLHPATRTSFELSMRRQWFAGCGAGDRLYGVGPAGVAHEYRLSDGGVLSPLGVGGSAELQVVLRGAAPCGPDGMIAHGSAYARPEAAPLWYLHGGTPWRWPTLPPGMNSDTVAQAVIATSLDDVIVAWENLLDPARGVHRWNGTAWLPMSGAESTLAFSRSPTGRLHAVGPTRVQYWNGTDAWVDSYRLPSDQAASVLNTIWARSDTDIYVGTRDGRMLRFDGGSWRFETTPGTATIRAIAGTDTDTYAVGDHGTAWRRSGGSWQPLANVEAKTDEHFGTLTLGPDGIYATQRTPSQYIGGGLGRIWRFHGTTATRVVEGLSQPLEALVRTGNGHLVGLAQRDFILTTAPATHAPTLHRLDLTRAGWQEIGGTGVALATETPTPAGQRPMVAARQINQPLPFAAARGIGELPQPYWLLLEDRYYAGSSVPPLLQRVTYSDAHLPQGWDANLELVQTTDSQTPLPSTHDAPAHTVTTTTAANFAPLRLGPAAVPPTLVVSRGPGTELQLSWIDPSASYSLQASRALGPSAAWAAPEGTLTTEGQPRTFRLDPTSDARFYRLARTPGTP